MAQFLRNENYIEQELIVESDSEETVSFEHDIGHDEDIAAVGCDSNVSGS